jgi:hypothetical protein
VRHLWLLLVVVVVTSFAPFMQYSNTPHEDLSCNAARCSFLEEVDGDRGVVRAAAGY